jgi:hypothetical protein
LNELEQSEKAARRALAVLETEILELKAQQGKKSAKGVKRLLPSDVWEVEEPQETEAKEENNDWMSQIWSWISGSEQRSRKKPAIQESQQTPAREESSPNGVSSNQSVILSSLPPKAVPSPKES